MTEVAGARTVRAGARWMSLFTLAWLAIWTVQLTPVQLLLPLQLDTPEDDWIRGVVSSGLVLGIGGLAGIVAGPAAGALSDRAAAGRHRRRTGNRRTLTVAATVVQAASGVAIALVPTFEMTMVAAVLMGLGYGAFSTVGLAFAADLLPDEQDHARDLGIVNVTAALGQLIGPVLGAGLVALVGGFWLVFVAAAVLALVGGLLTAFARQPVRTS